MPRSPKQNKALRNRLMVCGGLVAALWGFYIWQPYEFDIIPRKPAANPTVDPDSSFLFSGKAKILVVTAHPDDSSFFIGGLLARLSYAHAEIHQIICTDGDKGYYPFEDWQRNRRVRRVEALQEAAAWGGKDILFLGEPDGRLQNNRALVDRIAAFIRRVEPDYVLCFDGTYPQRMSHSDHRRSGEAAWEAAVETGIPKWVLMFQTNAPNFVVDISDTWDAQQDLLKIHKSQFFGDHLQGVIGMVGDRAMKDGEMDGFTYGEGLRAVKLR